jgi:hypothetical protein
MILSVSSFCTENSFWRCKIRFDWFFILFFLQQRIKEHIFWINMRWNQVDYERRTIIITFFSNGLKFPPSHCALCSNVILLEDFQGIILTHKYFIHKREGLEMRDEKSKIIFHAFSPRHTMSCVHDKLLNEPHLPQHSNLHASQKKIKHKMF